jgi:DNA-binding MarR family transcriptional regulator
MQRMKKPKNQTRRLESAEKNQTINFGPLPHYLGYQIRQAQAAVFRGLMASIADLKVTPGEYGLLTMLDVNPGISQVNLAAVYKLDKSTLSLAVGRLVKRGLVHRTRSREDERYYALRLLPPGRLLLQRVRERAEAQERTMDAVLHRGERRHLLDMLQRISRALDR